MRGRPKTTAASAEVEVPFLSQRVLSTLGQPFLLLDADLGVRFASRAFYDAFQVMPDETLGKTLAALGAGQWAHPDLAALLEGVLSAHTSFHGYKVAGVLPLLGFRSLLLSGLELDPAALDPAVLDSTHADLLGSGSQFLLLVFEDITEREVEKTRQRTQRRAGRALRAESRTERAPHPEENLRAIRVADGLQRALLQPIPENAFPGLAVTTAHVGARNGSIGGDFFDAFLLPSGSVALVVGDVEGHGLEAAMRIGEIKYSLRAFLRESMDPGYTLSRLNDMVNTSHRLDAQAEPLRTVLSLVVISPYTWEATFARAGAEPPLILKADGAWERVEAGGILLGAAEENVYGVQTRILKQGETLLMYTDGLTEARAPQSRSFFGVENVAQQAREALQVNALLTDEPLRGVGEAVLGAALAHAGGLLADDACLLLARRR